MKIHIIVAMTKDRVIGKRGALPWHIHEDAKLFRELTTSNTVIMGKNTWLSLPDKYRPLPQRANIIVSGTLPEQKGAVVCKSVEEALEIARGYDKDLFCIGGAQLYATLLPFADELHISWVKGSYDGDTYFPEVDMSQWDEKETKDFEGFVYKSYARKAR